VPPPGLTFERPTRPTVLVRFGFGVGVGVGVAPGAGVAVFWPAGVLDPLVPPPIWKLHAARKVEPVRIAKKEAFRMIVSPLDAVAWYGNHRPSSF